MMREYELLIDASKSFGHLKCRAASAYPKVENVAISGQAMQST